MIHVPRSCCTDPTAGGFGFGVGIAVGFGVAVGGGIGVTVDCGVAVGNMGDGVGAVAAGCGQDGRLWTRTGRECESGKRIGYGGWQDLGSRRVWCGSLASRASGYRCVGRRGIPFVLGAGGCGKQESSRNDQCCGRFTLELRRVTAGPTVGGVGINDIKLVCHRRNIKSKLASLPTVYLDVEV